MAKYLPWYTDAALLTLRVGALGIVLALAAGLVVTVVRYYRIPVLAQTAAIYTELSRNTPLLVQLFFLYFGLPKIGVRLSGEWCAVIGLVFLGASYMAEALRSGLTAVEKIQTESARVLVSRPCRPCALWCCRRRLPSQCPVLSQTSFSSSKKFRL